MQHNITAVRRAVLILVIGPVLLAAQAKVPGDSVRQKRDSLETVIVRAVRGTLAAPAAQTTVTRADIAKSFAGQDAPLFLNSTPSVTTYSEAGGFSGYSYLRLRGVDQTHLNITVDGVPLNDPEDQVLYFSNVPDFLNSIQSVQIQRGVGSSTFGTTSYAGSLNFQSIPLATTPRGGRLDLTGGSFNTARASAQYSTGVLDGGWAGYARISKQHTDGYRHHSGNDAQSAFVSGGWFGAADALKFTGMAGVSGTREAYEGSSEAELAADRRTNELSDHEGDRFHQEMASLQYTHASSDNVHVSTTAYRNSAAGAYDVDFGDGTIGNYFLAHVWYGLLSTVDIRVGDLSAAFGAHVSDYHREHALAMRPNLTDREYTNVGFKQEQSAFGKLALDRGAFRFSADLQFRRAAFRYQPSFSAGITGFETSWTFINPKIGMTWHGAGQAAPLTIFASVGSTNREPARNDLFAGADDIDKSTVASVLPLSQVKPEQLLDAEVGAAWTMGSFSVAANLFDMEFHNEIAAIGALSLTGSPLRKNVDRSYRRGLELEGEWHPSPRWKASANLTIMRATISTYHDDRANATYHNVEPLLTPPVISSQLVEYTISSEWSLRANGKFVDRTHLANDGNPSLTTPSYYMADAGLTWRRGATELRVQVYNVLNSNAYSSGYASGGVRYFYPIATRNFLISTRVAF